MKKSTDDLMKILRSKSSVDEYFDENDSEIFFGSLSELSLESSLLLVHVLANESASACTYSSTNS